MKKIKKRLGVKLKAYYKTFEDFTPFSWFMYFGCLFLFFGLLVIGIKNTIVLLVLGVLVLILWLYTYFNNKKFIKYCSGNGIIFGGRGKGKGLLFQKRINADDKHFTNVPYNEKSMLINIKEYIQSIGDNTIKNTIENTVKVVDKIEKFEGVNVYWDDVSIYAPNFMDAELKKQFPSMPLTLAINRHLYDAFMIIAVQSVERPYKIVRELQTDFSIKALGVVGFGALFSSIPILRFFISVKYRYYEEKKSAESGMLPFKPLGVINDATKQVYITSGQATKEVYEASNGVIFESRIFMRKSRINYDTRYFHTLFFGVPAPGKKKKKRKKA